MKNSSADGRGKRYEKKTLRRILPCIQYVMGDIKLWTVMFIVLEYGTFVSFKGSSTVVVSECIGDECCL